MELRIIYVGLLVLVSSSIRNTKQSTLRKRCHSYIGSSIHELYLEGVICEAANLSQVPSNLPKHINYLKIAHDSIRNLTVSSLAMYPRLQYLVLLDCGIQYIEKNTFLSMEELVLLDLTENGLIHELPSLPSSVETLILNSMGSTFFERQEALDSIVPAESCLERLYVQHNDLRSWPSFVSKLTCLNEVLIDGNEIEIIMLRDVAPLCQLKFVDFTGANISRAERNVCNCRFVLRWASKKNLGMNNLVCPEVPGVDDKLCEIRYPDDRLPDNYEPCFKNRDTPSLLNFVWIYFIYSMIAFVAIFVVCNFYVSHILSSENETSTNTEIEMEDIVLGEGNIALQLPQHEVIEINSLSTSSGFRT